MTKYCAQWNDGQFGQCNIKWTWSTKNRLQHCTLINSVDVMLVVARSNLCRDWLSLLMSFCLPVCWLVLFWQWLWLCNPGLKLCFSPNWHWPFCSSWSNHLILGSQAHNTMPSFNRNLPCKYMGCNQLFPFCISFILSLCFLFLPLNYHSALLLYK